MNPDANQNQPNQPVVGGGEPLPPAGTPPQPGVVLPQMPDQTPLPPQFGGAPQKSKKPLFIALAIVVVLALAGGAAFVTMSADKGGQSANNTSTENEESSSSNNAVVADDASDFDVVCEGGSVSNAPDLDSAQKPYKVAIFSKDPGPAEAYYLNSSAGYDKPFYVSYDGDVTQVPAVACLEVVDGSEQKELDCEYEKSGQTVTVAYYSLKYELTFRSAKDGKKVGESTEVNAPATSCPFGISYDSETMRGYAKVDDAAVAAAVTAFATAE